MTAKSFKIGHPQKLMLTENSTNRAYPENLAMEKNKKRLELVFTNIFTNTSDKQKIHF